GRRADRGHGQALAIGAGQDNAELHGSAIVLAGSGSDDDGHGRPPVCSSGWWSPASAICLPRTDDLRPKTKKRPRMTAVQMTKTTMVITSRLEIIQKQPMIDSTGSTG